MDSTDYCAMLIESPERSRRTKQLLRVMKLTAILIFIACLQVSARGIAQTVTLSEKNQSLQTIFFKIHQQTGYQFFYEDALLDQAGKIDIEVHNAPLESVLAQCFKNLPLRFTIMDKTIVINQAVKTNEANPPANFVPGELIGRIVNENQEPLSGANIMNKRTGRGTITNIRGEYQLRNIRPGDLILVSFIGYQTLSIKLHDEHELNLTMKVASNELDKVVIQAYGTTSQRLTTSNIAVVTKEEIEKQPVMNPLLALQGRVAGLQVTQVNGFASAPLRIELRGRNFIDNKFTSDPLYIIDGVPLTILELSGNSGYGNGSYGFLQSGMGSPADGQSPFFNINPLDIESIEVLKDADAIAIYGSRGANGVILITTKKGKPGKAQFDLRINSGVNKVTRHWSLMSLQQYLAMRREAFRNDGYEITLDKGAYDLLQWDTTRYTDWQNELYGHTGKNLDVQASLSGGEGRTSFRIGAGYTRNTNILTVSGADQRASLSLSVGYQSHNRRFNLSASSSYSFAQTDMIQLPGSTLLPPNAPPVYDSIGKLNYEGWGGANSSARSAFPFSNLLNPYNAKTNFLNSGLSMGYQPLKGLKAEISLGYNNAQAIQQMFTTIASQDPLSNPTGTAQFGNNRNTNWIIEPQINYDVNIGSGKLSFMAGGSIQKVTTDGIQLYGAGYLSDDLIRTITNAPEKYSQDNYGEYRYAAVFGRANYNWANKYIINLNMRRDGSSRFGPGKQFGNFGSVGAAWIFSEENWIREKSGVLSFGKLRASYGTTGSDAVGDYGYLSRWTSAGTLPYTGIQPIHPTQHANPEYHWQVNKKLDIGLELGFLKDRVHFTVDYYRDRCGDQLIQFPTPLVSGFGSVTANSPALVQNTGIEFSANATIIESKNFKWSMSFNTAINRNKLVAYPNISQSPYANTLVVGKSLNGFRLYHYIGVNPQTGDYSFDDRNHDGVFSPDDQYLYDLTPKFYGGLGMNFSYRNIQVSVFFNIKRQRGTNFYFVNGGGFGNAKNAPAEIIGKEWKSPGDAASIAKFTLYPNSSLAGNSDLLYTDASFIRLSNLSVSYSLPSAYLSKIGVKNCSLFIFTNNIFVITKYRGLDPETQNFGGMPPIKTITGGISFNF